MALVTYTGRKDYLSSFRTTVQLPAQGAWRICCETEEEVPLGSAIEVSFRNVVFKGTAVVSERQVHTYHVDVRPGQGLQRIAGPKPYSSGVVATMVKDAVSACGEVLTKQSILSTKLKDWFRFPGQTLPQILGQLGVKWHCLANGQVCVGEVWPEVTVGDFYFLSSYPQASVQQLMLEPGSFIWPNQTIKAVEYNVRADDSAHCVVHI
jgi:hypothetical protein